jgi:hypothetical protein
VVSANLRQSCNHLSKFLQHDHRYAPDDLPFGSPVYYLPANRGRPRTPRPERLQSLGPYAQRSTSLSLFHPDPLPERRAGTHTDVPVIEWLSSLSSRPYPHAGLQPLADCCLSRLRRLPTLTTHFTQIVYSRPTPFPSDWWLFSAANLEPLPPLPTPWDTHRVLAASAECAITLASLGRPFGFFACDPWGMTHYPARILASLSAS